MASRDLTSVCGIYGRECKYLAKIRKGCGAEKGKIFRTNWYGEMA